MTTTLLSLEQLLSESIGDWLEFDTSTNISTGSSNVVIASTLNNYDQQTDDYFKDWWLYITEGNNSGVSRRLREYQSATGTMKAVGSAFSAESSAVTVRLHRFDRRNKLRALNRAIEQLYPSLHRRLDDITLVTGNILPDGSFEWWTDSSTPKFYTGSNATLAQTTTAGLYRGQRGTTSMKVTVSADNGYAYISSDSYPRLLDLMGRTVNFYCWSSPEVADEAAIVIYTKQADATAQTLTSTTTNPAGEYTKLELENQTLNDDLVEIQLRFKVATNTKYAYFDDAVLCGMNLSEYLLPEDFQDGHLSQVQFQTTGYSDEPMYDIQPRYWRKEDFNPIIDDGTYKYLRLRRVPTNYHRLRLTGYKQLETLTADTDTISLDGERLNLIVAQAAFNLYQLERGVVSSEDKQRYDEEMAYWNTQVRKLKPSLMMMRPSDMMRRR